MARLLLIVFVVWLLVVLLKREPRPASPPPKPADPQPAQPRMLSCAHCGVYLPASEALMDSAQHPFCSPAHRDAGPAS
jgi:uncharacterized protein